MCDEKIKVFFKELAEIKEESEYEKQRKLQIAKNEALLKELGLIFTVEEINKVNDRFSIAK